MKHWMCLGQVHDRFANVGGRNAVHDEEIGGTRQFGQDKSQWEIRVTRDNCYALLLFRLVNPAYLGACVMLLDLLIPVQGFMLKLIWRY